MACYSRNATIWFDLPPIALSPKLSTTPHLDFLMSLDFPNSCFSFMCSIGWYSITLVLLMKFIVKNSYGISCSKQKKKAFSIISRFALFLFFPFFFNSFYLMWWILQDKLAIFEFINLVVEIASSLWQCGKPCYWWNLGLLFLEFPIMFFPSLFVMSLS